MKRFDKPWTRLAFAAPCALAATAVLLLPLSGAALAQEPTEPIGVVELENEAPPPPPSTTASGGLVPAAAGPASVSTQTGSHYGTFGGQASGDDSWRFTYQGFFRAPMNLGIGSRIRESPSHSKRTLSNLQVPNREYFNWQWTSGAAGPWAELVFGYGNGVVESNVVIQAFNFTDASFTDSDEQGAQLGISQAFVTLRPDVSHVLRDTRFNLRVGSFWNLYGGAGKYDAGAYEAFVIGRTHTLGATYHLDFDFRGDTIWFEHGVGVKQPNPSINHNTKYTLLHHAHVGANYARWGTVGLHHIRAWTQEPDHQCNNDPNAQPPLGACPFVDDPLLRDPPDGSLSIYGIDSRLELGPWGELFIGYSWVDADWASTVAPAVDVVHANGGGFFTSGVTGLYLNERGASAGTGQGNGNLHNLAVQYEFSPSTWLGPEVFGNTTLDAQLFGMFNAVRSNDDREADGVRKLKFGADLDWAPKPWLSVGVRADHLRPNSKIEEQNFSIVSPRIVVRSEFGSHEEIELRYSRYFYAQRACRTADDLYCAQMANGPNFPDGLGAFGGVSQPVGVRGGPLDPDAVGLYMPPQEEIITLQASIWW